MYNPKEKFKEELIATARKLVRPGYGLLAADESLGNIEKKFKSLGIEVTEENRRAYREMLFTTKDLNKYISGIIMFDETVYHSTKSGVRFTELMKSLDIIPGIKVDKGPVNIGGTLEESATTGIDGLGDRCKKYYQEGCRFAKWRAILKIGKGCPSEISLRENSYNLARYASICQDNGLCPIVEPEVLTDGDHTIEECAKACEKVFSAVQKALIDQDVILEGMLFKVNMVTEGSDCKKKASPAEIAWFTVRTYSRSFVAAVPGIVMLSGGQSEECASINLNAISNVKGIPKPWPISFSYARALQSTPMKTWGGKPENFEKAQEELIKRAKANSEASLGKYEGGSGSTESLYVKGHVY